MGLLILLLFIVSKVLEYNLPKFENFKTLIKFNIFVIIPLKINLLFNIHIIFIIIYFHEGVGA